MTDKCVWWGSYSRDNVLTNLSDIVSWVLPGTHKVILHGALICAPGFTPMKWLSTYKQHIYSVV